MRRMKILPLACALLAAGLAASAPVLSSEVTTESKQWTVWGGALEFNWNRELLSDLGFSRVHAEELLASGEQSWIDRLALREAAGLEIKVAEGSEFAGFVGGRLQARGGFVLEGSSGRIDLRNLSLRPQPGNAFRLDVIGADGEAWFYLDRLMYKLEGGDAPELSVRAMDLRIAPALAKRLGKTEYEGWVVAGLGMQSRVASQGAVLPVPKGGRGRWPGDPAPNGGVFEADVFMESFNFQYSRRSADSDGPGGVDGRVVFTPSSTLRNNRGTGSLPESNPANPIVATVPGDPLGTSRARYAADVAWHTKFSGINQPYSNDQHPYLIWNLYRIDAQGRIEQIGRSGVKHAFLTINTTCDDNPSDGHILGRGCGDTYGTGNNDSIGDLGPRSELVPATAQWGRCGSVYDADCNGSRDSQSPCSNVGGSTCSSWAFRLQTLESMIDPAVNAGATYFAESWYIAREDINILNTMQSRPLSFSWTGSAWSSSNSTPLRLGPAMSRWVAPDTTNPNERSQDIATEEGSLRVAMRVSDLGGGQFRYDYAVMNFDFARAVTQGAEPNLRVLRNNGFNQFSVPFPLEAEFSAPEFADGDGDAGTDWSLTREGGALVWRAAGTATAPVNPLNWGTLFRFSIVTSEAPQTGQVSIGIAEAGMPSSISANMLVPGSTSMPDDVFADGFESN